MPLFSCFGYSFIYLLGCNKFTSSYYHLTLNFFKTGSSSFLTNKWSSITVKLELFYFNNSPNGYLFLFSISKTSSFNKLVKNTLGEGLPFLNSSTRARRIRLNWWSSCSWKFVRFDINLKYSIISGSSKNHSLSRYPPLNLRISISLSFFTKRYSKTWLPHIRTKLIQSFILFIFLVIFLDYFLKLLGVKYDPLFLLARVWYNYRPNIELAIFLQKSTLFSSNRTLSMLVMDDCHSFEINI